MTRLPMSRGAAALLRALVARSGLGADRILLTDADSVDWQSLTFAGERHHLSLRITGPDALTGLARMCDRLEDAEFSIPGLCVADVAMVGAPVRGPGGAVELTIEALTIAE